MLKKFFVNIAALFLSLVIAFSAMLSATAVFAEEKDDIKEDNTAFDGESVVKSIYSLKDHTFYDGMDVYLPRGNRHDCQHLGIYLKSGDRMRIRTISEEKPENSLLLQLYANDRLWEQTEIYAVPNDDQGWCTLTAEIDCVPMIKTPCGNNLPTYQVEVVVENKRELPVYVKEETEESEFFKLWNESTAPYGIIESGRVIFMIPFADRNGMYDNNCNYKFTSLDNMLDYFDNMLEQYDRFAGLDYSENADPWNVGINSRYLIKTDKNGYGAAYYAPGSYVAMNSTSMKGFFKPDWINTHELGHGYGTVLGYYEAGDTLDVVEVWNNIYGYYYQILTQPKSDYWLRRESSNLASYENARVNNGYYESSYQAMLFFWINIFDLDNNAEGLMSYLNTQYRKDVYNGVRREYKGESLYAKYLIEGSGYNLIPYFKAWGLQIDDKLTKSVFQSSAYENVIPLRFLTSSDSEAQDIADKLGVQDMYSLVSSSDVRDSGLKGTLKINIDIDDIKEIQGKTVTVSDGKNLVGEYPIDGSSIKAELPAGIYSVSFPSSNTGIYSPDEQYVFATVKNKDTETVDISYEKGNEAFLSDYTIRLVGLADVEYFSASVDISAGSMTINRRDTQPHSYFDGKDLDRTYSAFTVSDESGNITFTDTQYGDEAKAINTEIEINAGDIITVYHKEPTREKVFASFMENTGYEEFSSFGNTTRFRVTEYGLQPIEGTSFKQSDDLQTNYYSRLTAYMNYLKANNSSEAWGDDLKLVQEKANVISAVESLLTNEQAGEFIEKFSDEYDAMSPLSPENYKLGDVNGSRIVDAADATLILQYYARIISQEADNFNIKAADVNGNDIVNSVDATMVLQLFAGIITSFSAG